MNLIAFSFDDSISWMTASILSSLLCSYSGIITSLPLLFFLLINRWLVVAFSLQGRCSPFSQPLSAKLVLFFSNNNGFMQKTAKSLLFSYYLCTFAYSNEPFLRPFGSKRAELERKQAGGSASSNLIIRRLQQDTDIRWFPVRNLENRVISQTSDKQRWFENSSKVTKKACNKRGILED